MTGYVCAPEWKAVPPASYLIASQYESHRCLTLETSVRVDVCTVVAKHGVRGLLEVRAEGDLVGHGAGGKEESRLFTGQLGHVGLECEGGGLVVDIVAEGGERRIEVHLLGRDCIMLALGQCMAATMRTLACNGIGYGPI